MTTVFRQYSIPTSRNINFKQCYITTVQERRNTIRCMRYKQPTVQALQQYNGSPTAWLIAKAVRTRHLFTDQGCVQEVTFAHTGRREETNTHEELTKQIFSHKTKASSCRSHPSLASSRGQASVCAVDLGFLFSTSIA